MSYRSRSATAYVLSAHDAAEGGAHWRRAADCGPSSADRTPPGFFVGLVVIVVIVGLLFVGMSGFMVSVR